MLCDCSEVRNQLARWNAITSEWNDDKSEEIETEYIELMQSGVTSMSEKIHEISAFIASTENQLSEL